uniref:PDZ domain-containing protein n=1 Tax=Physcomitrium patens TaxID=3218 RepID=A0A7I4E2D4_PHYPA
MAVRWSSRTRQSLKFIGKLSNEAPSKPLRSSGELIHSFECKANPSDRFGLRSAVVASLVFCTTSGALYTEQLNGRPERDGIGGGVTTPSHEGESGRFNEPRRTLDLPHSGDNGCNLNNRTPIVRVSNASPFPGSAAKSPSTKGRRNAFFGETAGSGFIIQSDGTILTNAHVVATDRRGLHKGSLIVTLQDGRNFEGEVVSFDSLSDLAVIKVNSSRPLPVVKLGSSKDLRPGEWVVALGSPLHLQNTITAGIISCVDRKSSEIGLEGVGTGYIQTDAAINQGNSGGPLLNLDGEVIGINTMKALAADGVSFAIPIDSAIKIVDQLKKRRHVVRPWLGMKMWELTEPRISQLKERRPGFPDVNAGILVSQVIPGSPAFRAGVLNDDVIIEFNGVPVTTIDQIVEALGDKVGTSFKMVVKRRNNEQVVLHVTAEEASPDL